MDKQIFSEKYEVEGEVARGGMGVIYKAVHTTLNRIVAIKVLHPQYSGDPAFLKRFLREARAMARLDHENIIRVFDVAEDHGSQYIVMEFFPGKDLKQLLIEKGRLSTHEALSIALQVANALAYAHARGIIHRDIKLGNIMIDNSGRAKIADFGIAAATDEISVTATGQIIGTPEYMSPEQARGEQLDGRSDLYSLGMVIYETLVGKTPYEGISRMAIVGKLIYEQEEFALSFPEDVPLSLQELVRLLLKKQAGNRLPDANTLVLKIKELSKDFGEIKIPEPSAPSTIQPTASIPDDEEGPTVMLRETPAEQESQTVLKAHTTPSVSPAPTPPPPSAPTRSTVNKTITPTAPPPSTPPPLREPTMTRTPSTPPPAEPASNQYSRPTPAPSASDYSPGYTQQAGITTKRRNMVPFIGGIAGVVILAGIILFYLSTLDEKPSPPPPPKIDQRAESETLSLSKIRDTQLSIRDIQDQISKNKTDADTSDAKKWAPKTYKEALVLETKGLEKFQEGGRLINQKQYEDADKIMQDALGFYTSANEGFIKARETAAAQLEKREKDKAAQEKERLAKAKADAEKTRKETPVQAVKQPEVRKAEPTAKVPVVQPPPPQVAKKTTPAAESGQSSRPDIEVVGEILTKFKMAYEKKDMAALQQMTEMSGGRSKFLQQLFRDYPTVRISITDLSLTGESASAVVFIAKLVNQDGETVPPGEKWKQAKVVIKKEGNKWGKIIW